jgi:hypothetical protein
MTVESLKGTMLASAQPVLHRAAVPILAAAGFPGEGCRSGRQRATGSVSLTRAVSIADAKAGVVEADHLQ